MDARTSYLKCERCLMIRYPYTSPPWLGEEICPDCKGDQSIDWIRVKDCTIQELREAYPEQLYETEEVDLNWLKAQAQILDQLGDRQRESNGDWLGVWMDLKNEIYQRMKQIRKLRDEYDRRHPTA